MTTCTHLEQFRIVSPKTHGCEACLQSGEDWVHLRLCLSCGHVGCCDDSKNKHATAHFKSTSHPLIESLEPEEGWRWCYVDEILIPSEVDVADAPSQESWNVMPDLLRSPIGSTTESTLVGRQPLPL